MRVLAATYRNLELEGTLQPVILLFGRTATGSSIAVLVPGQRPYFQLVEPPSEVVQEAAALPQVREVEWEELWHAGQTRRCLRLYTRIPGEVPGLRNQFQSRGLTVLAADIPFAHRYFYDCDLGSCVEVEGHPFSDDEYLNEYRTDIGLWALRVTPVEPFKLPLRILSFDVENSLHDEHLYCICLVVREGDRALDARRFQGPERQMLIDFMAAVRELDPDVITGYNIDGYDLPLLERRARMVKAGPLVLGRDTLAARQASNRIWRVSGRVVADAWWNVRRELRPKRESLGAVSQMLLGRTKHDVDPRRMDAEWSSDPQKVLDYCQEDAQLALEILQNIRVLDKYQDLATVAKLPLDEVMNGRTSTLIDSLMIRAADRAGVGVPLTRHQRRTGHIEGGYVHTLEPGLYHWVCTLDFKSMYPSVIIAHNLCFTTFDPSGQAETVSPLGIHFHPPSVRRGLLPRLLQGLMKDRERTKRAMQEASDPKERAYFQGLQEAIKVLMNSFYGVFASYFYRFTNLDIGASITAWARQNITDIIADLGREGHKVIYSDTDSIFVSSPHSELEPTVDFGQRLADHYTRSGAVLEFEKVLDPFFSHGAKKRYVGRILWPAEGTIVRGYESRRSDAFIYQTRALETVFARVLDSDPEGALQVARQAVTDMLEGCIPVEELVISKGVGDESRYKDPDSLPHVQALRKYRATGREVVPGMKISYVVTDGNRTPMQVEPYFDDDQTLHPDTRYYAGRIARSLARVTEVFGWSQADLILGSQQATLFDDFATPDEASEDNRNRASMSATRPAEGETGPSNTVPSSRAQRPQQQKLF